MKQFRTWISCILCATLFLSVPQQAVHAEDEPEPTPTAAASAEPAADPQAAAVPAQSASADPQESAAPETSAETAESAEPDVPAAAPEASASSTPETQKMVPADVLPEELEQRGYRQDEEKSSAYGYPVYTDTADFYFYGTVSDDTAAPAWFVLKDGVWTAFPAVTPEAAEDTPAALSDPVISSLVFADTKDSTAQNRTVRYQDGIYVEVTALAADGTDASDSVRWSSSNPAAVKVEQNERFPNRATLRAVGAGRSVVTITAGLKKLTCTITSYSVPEAAAVTVRADRYTDGGVTTAYNILGMEPGTKITAGVYADGTLLSAGSGESQVPVTFRSSNTSVAQVDENGIVTFGSRTGTATISAVITGDPKGRKASFSVRSVSAQVHSVTLKKADPEHWNSLYAATSPDGENKPAPADSGFTEISADQTEALAAGADRTFQLAADVSGGLSTTKLRWESSDATVAAVDATGKVTIKKAGEVVLSATAQDVYRNAASVVLKIINYAPTLESKTNTLNFYQSTGTAFAVHEAYGNEVTGIIVSDSRFSITGNREEGWTLGFADNSSTSTHPAAGRYPVTYTFATGSGKQTYTSTGTIVVAAVKPAVRVKVTGYANTFTGTSTLALTINAGGNTISAAGISAVSAEGGAAEYLKISVDGTVTVSDYQKLAASGANRIVLSVPYEGYLIPATAALTLPVKSVRPAYRLDKTSVTVYGEGPVRLHLTDPATGSEVDLSGLQVEYDTARTTAGAFDTGRALADEKKNEIVLASTGVKGTARISVRAAGWADALYYTVNVSRGTAPAVSLSTSSVKLNAAAVSADGLSGEKIPVTPKITGTTNLSITGMSAAAAGTDVADFSLADGIVTVSLKDGSARAGTYRYTLSFTLSDGQTELRPEASKKLNTALTVTVVRRDPAVSVTVSGTINPVNRLASYATAAVRTTNLNDHLSSAVLTPGSENADLFSVQLVSGRIRIRAAENADLASGRSYWLHLTLTFADSGRSFDIVTAVRVSQVLPSVVLSTNRISMYNRFSSDSLLVGEVDFRLRYPNGMMLTYSEARAKVDRAQSAVDQKQTEIEQLQAAIQAKQDPAAAAQLQKDLDAAESALTAAQTELAAAKQAVTDAAANQEQAQKDAEDAQKALDQANAVLIQKQKEKETAADTQTAARKDADDAAAALTQKQTEKTAAEDAKTRADADKSAADVRQTAAKTELDSAQKAEEDAQSAYDTADAARQNAEDNYTSKDNALTQAAADQQKAQTAYDAAASAKTAADQEVTSRQTAADAAQKAYDDAQYAAAKAAAETDLETAETELKTAQTAETAAADAETQARKELDAAAQLTAEKNTAEADAQTALDKAAAGKTAADQTLADATAALPVKQQAAADAATAVETRKTAETAANAKIAPAQTAVDAAGQDVQTAQTAVDGKKKDVTAAQAVIDQGAKGFFTENGGTGAVSVLTNDTKFYDIQYDASGNVISSTPYASLLSFTDTSNEGDATTLENMKKALEYIAEYNTQRTTDTNHTGLSPLKLNDTLMAIAEVQANASDVIVNHTRAYGSGENLAWGFNDPNTGWYTEEKFAYDNQSLSNADYGAAFYKQFKYYPIVTGKDSSGNPIYDRQTGHYTNATRSGYAYVGIAYNNKATKYSNTWSMDFASDTTKIANLNGGASVDMGTSYDAAEYITKFTTYYNKVHDSLTAAQTALSTAQTQLDTATAVQTAAKSNLEAARTAAAAATEERQKAETALVSAKQDVETAKTNIETAKTAAAAADAGAASAQTALDNAKSSVSDAEASQAEKNTAYTAAAASHTKAAAAVKAKTDAVSAAQAKLNDISAKESAAADQVQKAGTALADAKTAADSAASAVTSAAGSLASAKANQATAALARTDAAAAKDDAENTCKKADTSLQNAKIVLSGKTSAYADAKTAAETAADAVQAAAAKVTAAETARQQAAAAAQEKADASSRASAAFNTAADAVSAAQTAVNQAADAGRVKQETLKTAEAALSSAKEAEQQKADDAEVKTAAAVQARTAVTDYGNGVQVLKNQLTAKQQELADAKAELSENTDLLESSLKAGVSSIKPLYSAFLQTAFRYEAVHSQTGDENSLIIGIRIYRQDGSKIRAGSTNVLKFQLQYYNAATNRSAYSTVSVSVTDRSSQNRAS